MYVFVGFVSRPSQRKAAWKENCSLYGLRGMKTAFNTEILENSLLHFPVHSCFCNYLKRIQNFPGRNGNSEGGKKCMKLKKIHREGLHTPSTPLPLDPPMQRMQLIYHRASAYYFDKILYFQTINQALSCTFKNH